MSESATSKSPTVVDQVQRDHRKIEALLQRVTDEAGADRTEAFDELARYLEMHEAAEQAVVRPEISKVDAAEANSRQAEESKADDQIARLRSTPADSAEFDALFAKFRSAVLQHAQQEEREEHPELEANVSPARLVEMGKEFTQAEQEASD